MPSIPTLHLAIARGDESTAQRLIDNRANVNEQTRYGATPLFIACLKPSLKMVEKLLDNRADVNKATTENEAPLHACVFGGEYCKHSQKEEKPNLLNRMKLRHLGDQYAVEKLIWARADVNKETKNGETPLIQAAYAGNDRIVTLLLDNRADVNRATKDGTTALLAAIAGGKF